MALLFVPLTTVSMATIAPQRMGNATSLFNLMRNIGGSVGIAITGTYPAAAPAGGQLACSASTSTSTIRCRARCSSRSRAGFMAAGSDAVTATQRAYVVLHGMLMRQASMVSFVTIFRLLGVVFLVMIPLVLLMKRPKRGGEAPVGAH